MKNKIIILLIFLAVLLVIVFVLSYGKMKSRAKEISREYIEKYKPDITFKSASIDEITLSYITLNTLIEVKNNLPFELPIEKAEVKLMNNSDKVFASANSSDTSENLKIPANSSISFNMKFKAQYSDLFETVIDAIISKSFKCNANIIITFTVYGKYFEFSYDEELVFIQ